MADSQPNRRVGSIEHVGKDGFIVEASDPDDPNFIGGKRLFPNFDELLRFLAEHLQVYKGQGAFFGIRPPGWTSEDLDEERSELNSNMAKAMEKFQQEENQNGNTDLR